MRERAKAPLWVVLAKVIDVPCVRELVTLAVLEIVCSGFACLSSQVWAYPFWLELARHLRVLFFTSTISPMLIWWGSLSFLATGQF